VSAAAMESKVEKWRCSLRVAGKPSEWENKQLLREIGIEVPKAILIEPGASETASKRISAAGISFPCVAKVCSGEILHKTEEGGVILDLSEQRLAPAVGKLRESFPASDILIEEMVQYEGSEIIVGALYDPTFGPAIMAGAGGILTELYKDVSFRLAPCTRAEAHRLLEELTIYPTLRGYRGLSADVKSLAHIIEKVADLAVALIDRGCQLDINPIVWAADRWGAGRWVALDVKIVMA